jgi:hypothetical protein
MTGADADELERLGRHMQAAADQLDAIRTDVSAAFNRTHWEGEDGDYFRGQWNHRLSGLLHTSVTATREASAALCRNADQQRLASGTDGGSPVAGSPLWLGPGGGASGTVPGIDVGGLAGTLVDTGGRLMLIPGLLTVAGSIDSGVKAFLSRPFVDALLRERPLFGISESARGLAGVARQFDKIGPLAVAGLMFDGTGFITGLASDPRGADTYKAGIDTVFDLAEIGTAGCLPLSVGIGVAHLGYDALEMIHPGIGKEAFEAVGSAASTVADVAVDTFTADVQAVQGAAGAVGDVVSGGVNAVRNFFHW